MSVKAAQKQGLESSLERNNDKSELEAWEKNWPTDGRRPTATIIYDPAAAEVSVSGHSKGKSFQKTFPLEKDLATTLQQVNAFVSGTNEEKLRSFPNFHSHNKVGPA